ncbi:MAG: amino acid ABC transporter permease [Anaerolineae bacterium]
MQPPDSTDLDITKRRFTLPFADTFSRWPWWAVVAAILGVLLAWYFTTDETYSNILRIVGRGIGITLTVTFLAYTFSVILGLIIALGRVSRNFFIYQIASFYVEILRGVPTLVLLLYIAFVGFPVMVQWLNGIGRWIIETPITPLLGLGSALEGLVLRDIDNTVRVVIALTIAYSAFIAEIFRAGIESIEVGQMEAGRALGMSYWQAMRYIVLPQAIRRVLPPLGNDFIAMLKDSSLVSALGVQDITRLATLNAANTYRVIESYNVVAYLYLVMTLLLSLVVKQIEKRMSRELNDKS